MENSTLDLSNLAGHGSESALDSVPRPRSRWKTRVALPLAIFGAAVSLLAYSARGALAPAVGVWVVPVVAKALDARSATSQRMSERSMSGDGLGPLLVQAPGWVEPAPYAVNIPALAEGVIKEVMILEGDRVETGQVIARLVDDDARLSVRAAEADLAALNAEVSKAEFELDTATARAAELNERLKRIRELAATGGIAKGELTQLEFRTTAAETEISGAKAMIDVKKANVVRQEVSLDEARLQLSRMEIRTPIAGTILSRLVEPGARISMSSRTRPGAAVSAETMSGTVARLYDPSMLQIRAEIPLADSAKIEIGGRAQITTEALPDQILNGSVTRVVHEANIQRNTVQVKVLIEHPVPALKPEMLARVKLYPPPAHESASQAPAGETRGSAGDPNATVPETDQSGVRLIIPVGTLINRQANAAQLWAVNKLESGETEAELRTVSLAGETADGSVEILQGLRMGDRVIADAPSDLGNGDRVRVLGEKSPGVKKEPS